MSSNSGKVVLLDLPTFPRGVISLSLPTVAAYLRDQFEVVLLDLNVYSEQEILTELQDAFACGIKVSTQNYRLAIEWTGRIRSLNPSILLFWGGEFTSLLPDLAQEHAPSIVCGQFDAHAQDFMSDLGQGALKKIYSGRGNLAESVPPPAALDLVDRDRYFSFMGLPLETSRGCKFKCTFCMVHSMQPDQGVNAISHIRRELRIIRRNFVNVIDYNIGNDKTHLLEICAELENSNAWGWTGEMCIENLDDDEILAALQKSRCRIIYCGLESVDANSLRKINKSQNNVSEYKRIIRKAQSYGIEVASGFILGLPETTESTFKETLEFYEEIGVIYVKFTFLTYNPGTKVHSSMKRMGEYLTDAIEDFDGNHLTFLPRGVDQGAIYAGGRMMMNRLYSIPSILRRSKHLRWRPIRRAEFILFNFCYGSVYELWLKYGLLDPAKNRFPALLLSPFKKSPLLRCTESFLSLIRAVRFGATRKRSEIAILSTLLAFLLTVVNVAWTEEKKALPRWADPTLSRQERLESCRSCHAETYSNWEKGPHAAATLQLEKYRKDVAASPHYPEEEKNIVKRDDCINCHAPHNLFENKLPLQWPGGADKSFSLSDRVMVRPDHHQSSIDCLSCHAAGNRVVTRADYKPSGNLKKTPDFCDPLPSTMFSNMNTCLTCHVLLPEQHYGYYERHPEKKGQSCNSCHMDRRADGTYNHYEFWARDSVSDYKRRPAHLKPFDKVELIVQKFKKNHVLTVLWKNDFSPHNVIPSGPRQNLFVIEMRDKSGKVFFKHNIRFAAEDSSEMGPRPPGTTNWGLKADNTFELDYDLPKDFPREGTIRLKVFRKVSYYLPDSDARLIYEREVSYEAK